MKLNFIECKLLEIKTQDKGYGTEFVLTNIETNEEHIIKVDENIERVKGRLKEQYEEDNEGRKGIYLSRGMINININTKSDIWDINEENWNYYRFNKEDIANLIFS